MLSNGASTTHSATAYDLIRSDIVTGTLGPDEKLRIKALQARYDIGAAPLREALSRLAGEKLVKAVGQRGFTVAPATARDAAEIGALRQLLEAEALRQSLAAGDKAWEEALLASFVRLERLERRPAESDLREWERANAAFHLALVVAAPSEWLRTLREMLYQQHERYRHISRLRTRATRAIQEEHRALLDAALDRDPERAVTIMTAHIARTNDAVCDALRG